MNQDKDFLGKEPVGRLLLKLALPTVTAQVINMLYNIVDRIYIGHIPDVGAMALTGVGVCMPLIMIVTAFASFIGMGGAPRASIFMGKGDYPSAEKTLGNCFFVQVLFPRWLSRPFCWWETGSFSWPSAAAKTRSSNAVHYMNVYAVGTLFVQLTPGG